MKISFDYYNYTATYIYMLRYIQTSVLMYIGHLFNAIGEIKLTQVYTNNIIFKSQ